MESHPSYRTDQYAPRPQEQQLLVAGVRIALDHFGEGIPAEAAGVRLPEKNKTPAGRQAAG